MTRKLSAATILAIGIIAFSSGALSATAGNVELEWHLAVLDTVSGVLGPDGVAVAEAADGSQIILTGSGGFELKSPRKPTPSSSLPLEFGTFEESSNAHGGGTWETRSPAGITGSGTYEVREVLMFTGALGVLPGSVTSEIGNTLDARAGHADLKVEFSDGDLGILRLGTGSLFVGSPDGILDGALASKGAVSFRERIPLEASPVSRGAGVMDVSVFTLTPPCLPPNCLHIVNTCRRTCDPTLLAGACSFDPAFPGCIKVNTKYCRSELPGCIVSDTVQSQHCDAPGTHGCKFTR